MYLYVLAGLSTPVTRTTKQMSSLFLSVPAVTIYSTGKRASKWKERKPVYTLRYKLDLVKVQYLRIPTGGNKSTVISGL